MPEKAEGGRIEPPLCPKIPRTECIKLRLGLLFHFARRVIALRAFFTIPTQEVELKGAYLFLL